MGRNFKIRRLIDLFVEIKRLEIKICCDCLHVSMLNQLTKKILILSLEATELMKILGLRKIEVERYLQKHPELFSREGFTMRRNIRRV